MDSHSIPGQWRHSSTPSWRRALITATLYLPSHRRPQPTSSNECLTLLPALSRARRNTTADWHESCATSFIGSVCRSGSSSSSAPWCTAVYTQLCSPVPLWLLHPGRECCRSQSTTIRQPPSSCRSRYNTSTFGRRAFSVAGPTVWPTAKAPRPIAIDWQFPSPA